MAPVPTPEIQLGQSAPTGAIWASAADSEPFGPQAFLNADQREGIAANGKTSFTIDRAGLQLTGFNTATDGSLTPQPGWGGVAGRAFTVTYAFRAAAPTTMPDD